MARRAERVVLHIGAPKSGTTYLQSVLWNSRQQLRTGGVVLPGRRRFDHTRAALAITNAPASGRLPAGPRQAAWNEVRAAVRESRGTVLVSDEWFVRADADQAARAVRELGGAEVHVVFSARDFVRQVPAAWQEELKLGLAGPIDAFFAEFDSGGKWSWATLDPAEVLPRWGRHLPAAHIHVVTVPRSGAPRDLLWRRFATACGIPAELGEVGATDVNESLGVQSARLLQELGPALREAIGADWADWTVQYRWLRRYFAHTLLVPLGGTRIGLTDHTVDALRRRSLATAEQIRHAGWDVVGDLDDLAADEQPPTARHPDSVTDAEMLEVAARIIPQLLADLRRATEQAESRQRGGAGSE